MTVRQLVKLAMEANAKITARKGEYLIRNNGLSICVYFDDCRRFISALRADVRIDHALTIRTVKRCAEILGVLQS